MVERENLSTLSDLALRRRREGLSRVLPPLAEVLRGSLMERYLTCGNSGCKCARGQRHGPVWYLSDRHLIYQAVDYWAARRPHELPSSMPRAAQP